MRSVVAVAVVLSFFVAASTTYMVARTVQIDPVSGPSEPLGPTYTPRLWWTRATSPAAVMGLTRQIFWVTEHDETPLLPVFASQPAFPLDTGCPRWLLRDQSAPATFDAPRALRFQWVYVDFTWADAELRVTYEDGYLGAQRGDIQHRTGRTEPWCWWDGRAWAEERPNQPWTTADLPDTFGLEAPTLVHPTHLRFAPTWTTPDRCPEPQTAWHWDGQIKVDQPDQQDVA